MRNYKEELNQLKIELDKKRIEIKSILKRIYDINSKNSEVK